MALGFANNEIETVGALRGSSSPSSPDNLLLEDDIPIDPRCVEQEDAEATVAAFMGAVQGISEAYFDAGGGDANTIDENLANPDKSNETGCKAAYAEAMVALGAAYAYAYGPVLFKPTLTAVPYTYRNELNGALSYFIGTECVLLGGKPIDVFPPGNSDGSFFQEYGFGLRNSPQEWEGLNFVGKGWIDVYPEDFTYMTYKNSPVYCDTAIAIGRICFVTAPVPLSRVPSLTTCVDKTFTFKNSRSPSAQLRALLTSHHSSSSITGRSLTMCQAPILGFEPEELIPDVQQCEATTSF